MNLPREYQTSRPPRQIECQAPTTLERLDALPCMNNLVDYSTFRASVGPHDMESCALYRMQCNLRSPSNHEKRLTLLRERQDHQRQKSQQESVRASMVDLVPYTSNNNADSDEDSEVLFALKVSKPARLVRRRRGTLQTTSGGTATATVAAGNRFFSHGSAASLDLLDESMTLSMMGHWNFLDDSVLLQPPVTDIDALPIAEESAPTPNAMGDYSQTCVPNHDSFQSVTAFPVIKPPPADPRKKRKSMMQWLANQQPKRNLLAQTSKDPAPPTFVKVIYLNDKLESAGSTHGRRSMLDLDDSHHRKLQVASTMA